MAVDKQSFLSNIVGRNTYDYLKSVSKTIVAIGTCIIAVLLGLSFVCHYKIVSNLLNLFTGSSLLFVCYVIALILLLDIEVDISGQEINSWNKSIDSPKPFTYKLTIVWAVVLVILGITAIFFSNKYRKFYAFECETFLVDCRSGIYHLDWDNDCEIAAEAAEVGDLEIMKGYQIDKTYSLCPWCEEWAEEAEFEVESNRYFRR